MISGTTPQTIANGEDCSVVRAVPKAGYLFDDWTGTGGFVTTTTNPLTVTNVTANMDITANFIADPNFEGGITYGSLISVKASQFTGMDNEFTKKPKISGEYTDVIKNPLKVNAALRPITKVGTTMQNDTYQSEWAKIVKLYDKSLVKAAVSSGTQTTAEWLNANPIDSIECVLNGSVKTSGGATVRENNLDGVTKYRLIVPPVITGYTSWDGNPIGSGVGDGVHMKSIVLVNGKFYGSKLPKVSLEYTDPTGKIKQTSLKVLKVYPYTDAKGRQVSCMDIDATSATYGDSQISVAMPGKWWEDWGTRESYSLILDNQFGIATIDIKTKPAGDNTKPVTGPDSLTIQSGESSYVIDVLKNDADAEADKITIVLPSKATDKLGAVTVQKDKVVYKVPKGLFDTMKGLAGATLDDVFSYEANDGFGGKQTTTVTVSIKPPAITSVTSWSGAPLTDVQPQSVLMVNGTDFGEKAPVVTMEYIDAMGVAQSQKLKIVGQPQYPDYKGRPNSSYTKLNPVNEPLVVPPYGTSQLLVELPKSFWKGWVDHAVIQIKVTNNFSSGFSANITTTGTTAGKTLSAVPDTVPVNSGDYDANNYYLIDVLANDSDTLSGKVTIQLQSKTSARGGKLSVDSKINKVKYIRPSGVFADYVDTFSYSLKDEYGHTTGAVTVTVNVNLNP
jgi:uncharacterized repeat protein (TIGR02543 family)